tara:strand:+ start:90 stop:290 length:201 start_codon:yes stop_codon:yes gene_type:complete
MERLGLCGDHLDLNRYHTGFQPSISVLGGSRVKTGIVIIVLNSLVDHRVTNVEFDYSEGKFKYQNQ